jgi:DNA-binding transcriptional regulator YiaG
MARKPPLNPADPQPADSPSGSAALPRSVKRRSVKAKNAEVAPESTDRPASPQRTSLHGDKLPTQPKLSGFPHIEARPKPSLTLFSQRKIAPMAAALPIWEASSILTQRQHLPWHNDADGKLFYAKDIGNGQGAIHFWVTEDLEAEHPATLAGAAALAVIDTFDIRAACMHLIYAAHAAQLDKPWEQELIIDDQQIEAYLGLKKRTDKNKQEKLALIAEIAKQPCKITTFISHPKRGKVKGFTLEEGRLWHMLGTRYHYQEDLFGQRELAGITFVVKPGLWARHFLNEEGRREKIAYCQQGLLPQNLLESVMSVWQHREGAARLMVWLLFQTQYSQRSPLSVAVLMEIAYGHTKVQQATERSDLRKKLASTWDEDLLTLHDRGWQIQFDAATYPLEIQPSGFGRTNAQRPRGFFDRLLAAQMWIKPAIPREDVELALDGAVSMSDRRSQNLSAHEPSAHEPLSSSFYPAASQMTGSLVRQLRTAKGWSQRKFSALTGISQGLISMIETEERSISAESETIFRQVFDLGLTD